MSQWFARFENEYNVSFKRASRRFDISRAVRKVRHEIGWESSVKGATQLENHYIAHNRILLGTSVDGDCGLCVMCHMLGHSVS